LKTPEIPEQSTTFKLLRGSLWNGVSQFGSQALNLAITILLARRLTPADFGIFGMAVIFTAFIGYFSEFGLTAGLIQRKEIDSLDIDSVFWISAALSCMLYALMFLGAPYISAFYDEPRLTLLVRVVFLGFLIMPFNFIPEVLQTKRLEYRKITAAELFSVLFSGIVAVSLACIGYGVWSLVWQNLAKTASRAAAIGWLTGWRPKLQFSWKRLRTFLETGIHFTLNNLLQFAFDNTDYLLVGKMLGENMLGIYTMAFRISKYPVLKIEGIFGRMLFPAFSSFNDDSIRINRNFLRLVVFFLSWVTPVLVFGYFVSEPIIRILLGEKWMATIPLVRIFMVYLVFSSFCVQNQPVLIAINRLRTWNAAQLCATVLLGITGYAGIRLLGIVGMAIAFTAVTILFLVSVFIILVRMLGITGGEIYRTTGSLIAKTCAFTLLLAVISFLVRTYTADDGIRFFAPAAFLTAWLAATNHAAVGRVIAGFGQSRIVPEGNQK